MSELITAARSSRWQQRAGSTYVIAEAGVNHNGDVQMALRLIEAAAQAGADAVKFQTFVPDLVTTRSAGLADYQAQRLAAARSQYDMISSLVLPPQCYPDLQHAATECGVDFVSTPFDVPSLRMLMQMAMPFLKVPSGELTNLPFLREFGNCHLPIVLSTGMATLDEVGDALDCLQACGVPRDEITVLQCTTAYPTPMASVNLRAMTTIGNAFGVQVGYSDHTPGIEVAIAATALGATILEKHLTLSNLLPGPDHAASLEPVEFEAMVRAVRNIGVCMGDGVKRPQPAERSNMAVARRSIVASKSIAAGEPFTEDNLTTKRPGTGLSPMRWDDVINTVANRAYEPDEMIDL